MKLLHKLCVGILIFSGVAHAGLDCSGASSGGLSTYQGIYSGSKLMVNACQQGVEVPADPSGVYYAPLLDVNTIMQIYMCGAEPTTKNSTSMGLRTSGSYAKDKITIVISNSQVSATNENPAALDDSHVFMEYSKLNMYCQPVWNQVASHSASVGPNKKLKLLTCHYQDDEECKFPVKYDFDYSKVAENQGFAVKVTVALLNAAYSVREGIPLDPVNDRVALRVLNSTNLPLYQMLNVAAIHPAVGAELLGKMSVIYSKIIIHKYFEDLMTRMRANTEPGAIPPVISTRVDAAMSSMKEQMAAIMNKASDDMIRETAIMKQIMDITADIRKETMTAELQSSLQYTNSLLNAKPH